MKKEKFCAVHISLIYPKNNKFKIDCTLNFITVKFWIFLLLISSFSQKPNKTQNSKSKKEKNKVEEDRNQLPFSGFKAFVEEGIDHRHDFLFWIRITEIRLIIITVEKLFLLDNIAKEEKKSWISKGRKGRG
jgi:hypothetical protein